MPYTSVRVPSHNVTTPPPSSSSPVQVPAHVRFLGQLEWMKNWPLQQLLRHPTQSFMYYCRNRQVIVADSSQSPHIYVVRSGECCVLMCIGRVDCTLRDLTEFSFDCEETEELRGTKTLFFIYRPYHVLP